MKNIIRMQFLSAFLLLFSFSGFAQNSISGTVNDNYGQPLPGASIIIKGSSQGVASDLDGKFTISSDLPYPWTLVVSYTGYESQEVKLNANTSDLLIGLNEDYASLEELIITAGRKPEKAIDAVASVSVIGVDQIAAEPVTGDVNNMLRNTPGVQIVQNGAGESNVELRGSAIVNETNTLVLKDYQPLTSIANKRVNSAAIPLTPIDIAKIEVVRGPSGALYGPNVTSGVIHYITKDPFKYTGLDVYSGIGNQNQKQFALRYANNLFDEKFGYKLIVKRNQVDEFDITGDGLTEDDGKSPVIVHSAVKTLANGSTLTVGDTLSANLFKETYSTSVEATLVYKFAEDISLTYVGSINDYRQNFRNQTAHLYNGGRNLLNQLRFSAGNFFATAYIEKNYGSMSLPGKVFSFNYTRGDETVQETSDDYYYDFTAQYNLDLGENTNVIVGGDMKMIPAFEDPNRYGVFSNDNAYKIYGAYVSVKHNLSEKLSVNAAGRYDQYDAYEQGAFSPRLGVVFKPNEVSAIRFSANRSFSAESQLRTFLDFRLPPPVPTNAVGVASPVTYNDPVTQFNFGQVDGGSSFELADIIAALANKTENTIDVTGVSGTVTPALKSASPGAPVVGKPTGDINSLSDAGSGKAQLRTVNSLELSYTTLIANKLKVTVDGYYNTIQNLQPQGVVPLSAGAQLDVTAVGAQIQTALAGKADQAVIDQLIAELGTSAPGPISRPGYGLIVSDVAQARGHQFNLGFPTFGKNDVSYFGVDLGLDYQIDNDWSVFGNFSYVSQNLWSAEDLGETNQSYKFYLNTPETRFNLGANYLPEYKFYGTLSVNSQAEFEGRQGDGSIFSGINPSRTIFNMSLGYRFKMNDAKLDIGVSANNLFDTEYQQFVNLPTIRRTVLVTAKIHLF